MFESVRAGPAGTVSWRSDPSFHRWLARLLRAYDVSPASARVWRYVPSRITFSLGPFTALAGLLGGLTVALLMTWPYLEGKESALRAGSSEASKSQEVLRVGLPG